MSSKDTSKHLAGRLFLPIMLLIIGSLQYRIWFGEGSLAESRELQIKADLAKVENSNKANRNRLLLAEIKDLKVGLASIEDRARSELGMIKEGETFYLLVEEKAKP